MGTTSFSDEDSIFPLCQLFFNTVEVIGWYGNGVYYVIF